MAVTPEQVFESVSDYLASNSAASWIDLSSVLAGVKSMPILRWANTFDVKTSVERAFTEKFGPKEVAKAKAKVPAIYISEDSDGTD